MNDQLKTPPANIILEVGGKTYKSSGETILEAMNLLEKPAFIKARGVLRVEQGGLKTKRRMNVMQIRRLFAKDFVREVLSTSLKKFLR